MNKNLELKKLFEEWKKEQNREPLSSVNKTKVEGENITKNHFCEDGIINEKIFEKEKIKVLFISNEANDYDYTNSNNINSSRIKSFEDYYKTGIDDWGGKMRKRICALYKVIINNYHIEERDVAKNFAFMNLNKRGGKNTIGDGKHLEEYCKRYYKFIIKEIEIINPDIIVWLGAKTYDMNLHINYFGAKKEKDKIYLYLENKKVPILRVWHTSYWRANNKPMKCFKDKTIGKQATKMKEELEKYNIL